MISATSTTPVQQMTELQFSPSVALRCLRGQEIVPSMPAWLAALPLEVHAAQHPGWLRILQTAFRHEVFCIEARRGDTITGILPLALVKSLLFGRFLVSLPYVNSAGVVSRDPEAASALIDKAVELADEHDVRYLELRHEAACEHPKLNAQLTSKVHMRLALPASQQELSTQLKSKLRSQIRAGEKHNFEVLWGSHELLPQFYDVFSRNMRDLGTPVYGKRFFAAILTEFASQAELCVLRLHGKPVASALLIHGQGVTEVPSASSLREFNATNANMVMYWNLLVRAVERGQQVFDFGRSTLDSNTFRFKKQWGAAAHPAIWQYYVRKGDVGAMRPEGGKYDRMIQIWRRLPLALTRWIGPPIVRGIP